MTACQFMPKQRNDIEKFTGLPLHSTSHNFYGNQEMRLGTSYTSRKFTNDYKDQVNFRLCNPDNARFPENISI